MSVKDFKALTTQNVVTQKSAAQKRIIELLTQYHALGRAPLDAKATKKQRKAEARALAQAEHTEVPDEKLDQAASLLGDMKAATDAWIRAHTIEDDGMLTTRGDRKDRPAAGTKAAKRAGTDPKKTKAGSWGAIHGQGVSVDGQTLAGTVPTSPNGVLRIDPKRHKRLMGMARFQLAIEAEQRHVAGRRNQAPDIAQDPVVRDEAAAKALDDHYGDFSSFFSKLGLAIDALVPRAGDSASFEVSFSIPVPDTPVMITGRLAMSAKRADNRSVSAQVDIIPGIAAGVGVAKFNAALGMFTSVSANSGGDVMTLVSYALYRKLRQSNVPGEVTDALWGGSTTRFGRLKADQWSRGVEKKMWSDDAANVGTTWLEWGMKGEVGASAEASVLGVGGAIGAKASATVGSRYDQTSLKNRKGGAGEKNLRSDGLFTKYVASQFGRGAEKDLSRRSFSVTLSTNLTVGVLAGDLTATVVLRQQGLHKDQRKGVTNLNDWVFEELKVSGKLSAQIPGGQLIVGGALLSRDLIASIRDNSEELAHDADKSTAKEMGKVVGTADTVSTMSGLDQGAAAALDFASLGSMAASTSAGIEVEVAGLIRKAAGADRQGIFSIDVRLVSGVDIDAAGYAAVKVKQGRRMAGAKWDSTKGQWEPV